MIATPIGNRLDLTPRALETLEGVDEVWCEDTRHTQALLQSFGLSGKVLRRVDQHIEPSDLRKHLTRVQEDRQWIGVVSDAGTPGLSDPGADLIRLLGEFPEIRLEPVPGVSALSSFISVSGFKESAFGFLGFFPRGRGQALDLLGTLESFGLIRNWVFFESPHRIKETLRVLEDWCRESGVESEILLTKEMTKLHETLIRGKGADFLKGLLEQGFDERGEWVFSVSLSKNDVKSPESAEWQSALECLILAGVSAKSASQLVSGRFSVAKNLAYKTALEFQKKNIRT